MREIKDISTLYTLLQSSTDADKKDVLTSMIHAVDGTLDAAEQLEMVELAKLGWSTMKSMQAHSLNYARLYSYTTAVFYFNSLSKPGMYQFLPEPLRPWAHFGQRFADGAEDNTPLNMHYSLRDAWCEVDTNMLREGEQKVNLLALLQFLSITEYEPAEIRNNNWLLAMADYSVKMGYCEHVHEHLFGIMASWFPQYKTYLEHCAAFDLSLHEVMAMIPECEPTKSVNLPQDMTRL